MYCENCGPYFEQAENFCRVCGKGKNFGIYFAQKFGHDIFQVYK